MQNSVRHGAFAISVMIALIMAIIAYNADFGQMLPENSGFCLPAPSMWKIAPFWSWFFNLLMIGVAVFLTILLNQRYYFIQTSDLMMPAVMAILICCFPWLGNGINSSIIVLLINVISIYILFSCYNKPRSSQEIFVVASFMALGSMFQYAFLFYLPVVLLSAFIVKTFDVKTLPAMIIGTIAPYWCLIGTGIIEPEQLHFPTFYTLTNPFITAPELKLIVIVCIILSFAWFGMLINNSIKLLRENSNIRHFNNVINLFGAVSLLMMIIDFDNLSAYLATLIFCIAQQVSLSAGRNREKTGLPILIGIGTASVAFFVSAILIY